MWRGERGPQNLEAPGLAALDAVSLPAVGSVEHVPREQEPESPALQSIG